MAHLMPHIHKADFDGSSASLRGISTVTGTGKGSVQL